VIAIQQITGQRYRGAVGAADVYDDFFVHTELSGHFFGKVVFR
jgi:hypothetical protein